MRLRICKKCSLLLVALLPLVGAAGDAGAGREALERVLERAVAAAGGARALDNVHSLKLEAELFVGPLNQGGTLTLKRSGPDQWRLRQFLPVEGFPGGGLEEIVEVDGEEGFLRSDLRGHRPLSAREIRSVRLSNDPALMLDFLQRFPEAIYLGPSSRSGQEVEGIEVEDPVSGDPLRFFFSRESGHLASMDMTLVSEEMHLRIRLDFSDFRPVGNLVMPFHTRIDLGLGITEIRVKNMEIEE